MEHALNTNVAAQYDVNIAILIHSFKRFTKTCEKSPNEMDWIEMKPEAFNAFFSFWPPTKIKSLVNKSIKLNLLVRETNSLCVYGLTPLALAFYGNKAIGA